MKRTLISLLLLLPLYSAAQTVPATEIRAAWLTTNWRLDWPKANRTSDQQKEDFREILDKLKDSNFNTVFFQVRAQGTTFYRSNIESQSPYIKHMNFDPLRFAIDECHKRGLECHAWFVTFPMGSVKKARRGNRFLAEQKPSHYKAVKDDWYLDPGSPETKKLLLSLVKEIVSGYDIDGIHFDYIRYPSPDKKFPDEATYKAYGKGKNLYDWRRDNINIIVSEMYDLIKSMKNWVQVSSAPLGRYKEIERNGSRGWTAYETVFQDAIHWVETGKHDALYPMIYYRGDGFAPYLDDWVKQANGRFVVPGIGLYQILPKESNWDVKTIKEQIDYTREKHIDGQAYFRAGLVMDNVKGIGQEIKAFYMYPAKLPAMTWLSSTLPEIPDELEMYKDDGGILHITWQPLEGIECTYTVYASPINNVDTNDGRRVLATGIRGNSYSFKPSEGDYGFYYTVTASDRYRNESELGQVAFFSHGANAQ